jgi:hypothetical protein
VAKKKDLTNTVHARHTSREAPPARLALDEFRRRVDLFWGHPKTAELKRAVAQTAKNPRRLAPASTLRARVRSTLATLDATPGRDEYRLQKGITYRNGQLTSIWGDDTPLASDDRVLVITTTTTIMDVDSLTVDTDVLVFERAAGQ